MSQTIIKNFSRKRLFIFTRQVFIYLFLCGLTAPCFAQPPASTYPTRAVRLLIAYAPGGATDIVGRLLAQELSTLLGQAVVVENRAGGGTLLATEALRKASPDGYTLLFGTNAFVITPLLHDAPTYDPVTDFAPVALTTVQPLGLLVSPQAQLASTEQLIAYAKQHPGKLNFASSGNGTAQHLAGEAFRVAADIDLVHVAYKGASPALIDLLAGRVDMMFTSLVGNMEHVKEGRLILLATTGNQRAAATPTTPTVAQAGLSGFDAYTWQGVIAPGGTPQPIIAQLNAAVRKAAQTPKIVQTLALQGMEVRTSTPDEMRALWASDSAQYKVLLQRTKTNLR
jgi:tripartite-type tricarboxylate transporter receptor subunit TctC